MVKISMKNILEKIESDIERVLYASRWFLSPIYLALIIILILVMGKFFSELYVFITIMHSLTIREWIIEILELLDLTLLANLVLIMAFSGYENFISKIDISENHVDRQARMDCLDFSGLKLKIICSVIAISLIELLQDFLEISSGLNPNIEF